MLISEKKNIDLFFIIISPVPMTVANDIIQSFISIKNGVCECDVDGKRRDVLVRLALDDPEVFTFGELLENNEIQAFLARHKTLHNTFMLFAYGTYRDYLRVTNNGTVFTEVDKLTGAQETKLKQLSLVTLATQSGNVKYGDISAAICAQSLCEMEDFVIDALIYPGLVSGKLDQQNGVFCVEWVFVQRDVRREDVPTLVVAPLRKWACECKKLMEQMNSQAIATSQAIVETQKEKEFFIQSLYKVKSLNEHNMK